MCSLIIIVLSQNFAEIKQKKRIKIFSHSNSDILQLADNKTPSLVVVGALLSDVDLEKLSVLSII